MEECSIACLDGLDDRTTRKFWLALEKKLRRDDGAAAHAHLKAGRPIYYVDFRFDNEMVRKWPDGTQELVTVNESGHVVRVRRVPVGGLDVLKSALDRSS